MSLETLAQFFGWSTALNVAMYLISVAAVLATRDVIVRWNMRWFGLAEDVVARAIFHWLVAYKLGILLFALVPWLALTFMIRP